MSQLTIETREGYTQFYPGEELAGSVQWNLDTAADALEIRLFWYTSGKGTQDVEVVEVHRIETPAMSGQEDFAFTLPDQPYSFSGKLISLLWAIELVELPSGDSNRLELTLSPTGEEVLLNSLPLEEEIKGKDKKKGMRMWTKA